MAKTNVEQIRDWVSVLAIIIGLGAGLFNLVLKPQSDIAGLQYQVTALKQDVADLKSDLRDGLNRIWQRIK